MFAILPRLSNSSCRCLLLKTKLPSRHISVVEKLFKVYPHKKLVDLEKHRIVCEFPEVRKVAGFLKLRYSYAVIAVATLPLVYLYTKSGTVVFYLGLIGLVNVGLVFLSSKFCNNLIGKIFVNKKGDVTEVIVSALDESGRRLDRSHRPDDLSVDAYDLYGYSFGFSNVFVKDSDVVYKIHSKTLKYYDKEACRVIFGKYFVK